MACTKQTYVHRDFNKQELQNFAIQQLAADPTGVDLYEGRIWQNTTDNKIKKYLNGAVETFACESWVIEEINKLGQAQQSKSAAPGLLPVPADKVNGDLTTIVPGDWWAISAAGTITGIQGDDVLAVGDKIQFLGGDPTVASNWLGIQRNVDDLLLGFVKTDRQTVNLVASVPLTVASSVLTDIHSIQVYDTTGELIEVCISKTINLNERVLTSNVSLTGVVVDLMGKTI